MLTYEILGQLFSINTKIFKAQVESFFSVAKKERKFLFLAKLSFLILLLTTLTLGGSFGLNIGGKVTAVGGPVKTLGVAISEVTVEELPFEVEAPLVGEKSQGFSRYHPGVDIAANYGTPIKTISEGIVEEAGYRYDGFGKTVAIAHPGGFKSLYAHLAKIEVKKGEKITRGKIIGAVGLTGRTSGAHLHLEIYEGETTVNPENLLP